MKLNKSNAAGSSPIAHHHLSLMAAQRIGIGEARLIMRIAHESRLADEPQTDEKLCKVKSIAHPVATPIIPATASFRSFVHEVSFIRPNHSGLRCIDIQHNYSNVAITLKILSG